MLNSILEQPLHFLSRLHVKYSFVPNHKKEGREGGGQGGRGEGEEKRKGEGGRERERDRWTNGRREKGREG